jgi:hypothetical protein
VALAAGVAAVACAFVVLGGHPVFELASAAGFLVAVAFLIVRDSSARGRSGCGWLAACFLLFPLAVPAFLILAAYDRLRGRLGIEARWAPAGRWYLLAALVLAMMGAGFALTQVNVPSISVSAPGTSGRFSGSCSSALQIFLGDGAYSPSGYWPPDEPATLSAARARQASRCRTSAEHHMEAAASCLGAALLSAAAGLGMNRWRRRVRAALPGC